MRLRSSLFRIRSLLGDIEQRASLGQTVQDGVAAVDDVRQFAGRSLAGQLVFVTIGRGSSHLTVTSGWSFS